MKTLNKALFTIVLLFTAIPSFAQNDDAKNLVKQGIALHDEGKYPEAIAKYQQAIKLDPANSMAQYELAYSLAASGKQKDAIPYLEKLVKIEPKSGAAFDLLGNIYDDDNQADKAIDYYKKGIAGDPEYQRLHYNLAITYLRQKKYVEAEEAAVNAIKLDTKHASSQQVYAIATYRQNKRANSLLAWCSFLMLEPQSKRSSEGYQYIHDLLTSGIAKTGEKATSITMSLGGDSGADDLMFKMAVLAATTDKKNLSATDSLSLQLSEVFKIANEIKGGKDQSFFKNFYADYFKKLAASSHMPAFARIVNLTANSEKNLAWFKENPTAINELETWINTTERKL
jgi:tetratricopeptide (TPR) repeat protein